MTLQPKMASLETMGEEVSADKETISPHLDELLRDVTEELSAEEITSVVASIKNTFEGNFEFQKEHDLYSCLQLFTRQGFLSDQNLTLLERFVACKSSKKEDLKQRIENFKQSHQVEVTPRQELKGRETDLQAIMAKLAGKPAIVNLYGSGGLGKTTLAKEICLKWPGKSVAVDLRGVTEMKDVYFQVMLALDPQQTIIKYDENPVVEQLRKMINKNQSEVLLLLDNADQLSGDDGSDHAKNLNTKLMGFLERLVDHMTIEEKPRLKVLLTSRTRFHGISQDETVQYHELKALEKGSSKEILQSAIGFSAEIPQMEKLVELSKGKPVVLQVIAPILRQRIETAEKLLVTIEQDVAMLESQEKATPSAEHDIQESEAGDRLSEEIDKEQLLCFRKMFFLLPSDTFRNSAVALSLFCRPFSEEAAASILAADPSEAVIVLEGLRSRNVLSVDPERTEVLYEFHPLMRSFLESVGNGPVFKQAYAKAKDRFCKLYMTKMEGIAAMLDKDYVSAFQHFDHDKLNFQIAFDIPFKSDYLLVEDKFQKQIMVCYLVEAMIDNCLQIRKIFKSWAEGAEEDGKEGSLFRAELRCFEALQVLGIQGWKWAMEVLKTAENSLQLAHENLKDSRSYRLAQSIYLYAEGEIYFRKGSLQRALTRLNLSREIMEDLLHNHTITTRCLNAIGNCHNQLNNHEEALKFYTKAYEMRRKLSGAKNHLDLPFFKGQIGTVYEGQKQYDKAIQSYQEALELSKELKLSGILRLALFHRNIANAYAWKRDFENAYKAAMDGYEIRKDILGDHPDTARSAFQLGLICRSQDNYDEAEEFLAEAWRIEKSLEYGNHSAVRDRIVKDYTELLSGERKKAFQSEALEFYQRLWEEEEEFSYANKSIIDEINQLLSESGERKMVKKYEKEALRFYEMAWKSPDLQQLPRQEREEILRNILYLCKKLRDKELLKKYEGEQLEFLERQWEEKKEKMTTRDKTDILQSLQYLAAKQGDERRREKYQILCEEVRRETFSCQSNQGNLLTGSDIVQIPSARADNGDISGGGSYGDTVEAPKAESQEQLQIQSKEDIKMNTSEETSTKKCELSQEGSLNDPQEPPSGNQFSSKWGGTEQIEDLPSGPSKEKGTLQEDVKERLLWKTTKAASGTITSEGGEVSADGVRLVCPPGAVDNPVYISITLEDPVKYYGLIVQKGLENDIVFASPIVTLHPNGHLFEKPVTLTTKIKMDKGGECLLVLHGTEATDGKISWLDISQNSVTNVSKKEVSVEIERFSLIWNLWKLTQIRTKQFVSRLNLSTFSYTLSVLFKQNHSSFDHELALVFMSQDIFHEPYYKEHDTSALVQLSKDGFKLLRSADGPTDEGVFNGESLKVSVRLGEDYILPTSQPSSREVTVESHVWWSTGRVIRIPMEAIRNVRILCGKISVEGQNGHISTFHFCEQDLCGFVKRLLRVEGATFNLKPFAQKIGTSEKKTSQVMRLWKNEDDQLEALLQPWTRESGHPEDLDTLRKSLENLKEEDYKVTQRGQMHVRHLRELAVKIRELKIENADSMRYFTGKITSLCETILRDCCIELTSSPEEVERAASSEEHSLVYQKITYDTASKYQQMCSSSQESLAENFLAFVPHFIQDIKAIFRDENIPDVQSGLRGLPKDTLDQKASQLREAKQNGNIRQLVCEVCNILEELCMNNRDSQLSADLITKWGESLGIWSMLEYLKPFFQKSPADARLHKRLELFSRCTRAIVRSDVVVTDQVFMLSCFDVSFSLIHFAKFDPAKLVRFELTDSTNSPVTCPSEGVKYDCHNDTFSQLFFPKDEEGKLLRVVARAHVEGQINQIGAFQFVITLPVSKEKTFNTWRDSSMTRVSVNNIAITKQEVKETKDIQVALCSTQRLKLESLLDDLKRELDLQEVEDWKKPQVTPCHLTVRTGVPNKPGTILRLRLVYKWKSDAVFVDSEDFVVHADPSAKSASISEERFKGLTTSRTPEAMALDYAHSMESFLLQRGRPHAQIPWRGNIEFHLHQANHQTNMHGHICVAGDNTTLREHNTREGSNQRSLPPGPSSTPLRSITDGTSLHESTSSTN